MHDATASNAGAQVAWYMSASQTSFTPPNRDDYVFGSWTPWWGYRGWYEAEIISDDLEVWGYERALRHTRAAFGRLMA